MKLDIKKPCKNCPFRKEGAIELREGRLEEIVGFLKESDGHNFYCHKTAHQPGVEESMCMGSAVYMLKERRPSVALRFALATRMLALNDLQEMNDIIIEPIQAA
jgi:hypothetical protein